MEDVMKKVATLSVTGGNAMIRIHCRQVWTRLYLSSVLQTDDMGSSCWKKLFCVAQIYLKYLLDYPLGKKLKGHMEFVVAQLQYVHDTGRESVLEMLAYIFQTFPQVCETKDRPDGTQRSRWHEDHIYSTPAFNCFHVYFLVQNLLFKYSELFFAPLALTVVNDDSARCKKMAAMVIKALLAQLDANHQNTLYSFVNTWLNAEKVLKN